MKKLLLSFLALTLLAGSANAAIWTSTEGKTFEGEFKNVKDGVAFFRLKSGKIASVPISRLSTQDQVIVKNKANFSNITVEAASQIDKADSSSDRFSEAIRNNPHDPNAYYSRGLARTNLGNYDEALVDFDKAIALNPRHAAAHDGRGQVYS